LGDVVNLEQHVAQRQLLAKKVRAAAQQLDSMSDELFDLALQIACAGVLRAWNEAVPVGTIMKIDEAMLADTRDPRVLALLRLREVAFETIAVLQSPVP